METTPTRSALLELKDERLAMGEGYRFLDEKRLLLAARIVRTLERYRVVYRRYQEVISEGVTAFREGILRHGLEELSQMPAPQCELEGKWTIRDFFGVTFLEGGVTARLQPPRQEAVLASPEYLGLVRHWGEVSEVLLEMVQLSGNLYRLIQEYRRTERRARALEEVILPEIDELMHEMDMRLEELDQEEAVRARLHR
ncbi:MAG: ATPase [Magnetococcales bacterium]|nr:ATPase [Magnetococcales bacterium]